MTTYILIIGDSDTEIWGLSGRERLQRMLAPFKQATLTDDPKQIPVGASALVLRADHLFDARVLAALINAQTDFVLASDKGQSIAIRIAEGDVH
ncbi:MAG TPA: CDP-alcohol phosphatidyltransferase family protein, partial [Nitrosospira sp.]